MGILFDYQESSIFAEDRRTMIAGGEPMLREFILETQATLSCMLL